MTPSYPLRTLPELIWARAGEAPDATAVRQWHHELTYRQLVAGAHQVANELAGAGADVESRVVVCVTRRPHLVTAVLGVLAAGAAYVPIDPYHPARRRGMILADSGAKVAVVDEEGRRALADTNLTLIDVPAAVDADAIPPVPVTGLHVDNAAYVLYTSGSTGQPKGVVVSHRSVVAFVTNAAAVGGVDASTRGIGFGTLSFDVSVLDLFTPLIQGGTVCLVPEADRADAVRLQRFLAAHRVTWGFLAPALLALLAPEHLPDLGCVIVGGEASAPDQVARWARHGRRFLNWYGPTEATVSVTGSQLSGEWTRPLPIGRPMANHRCYVLDGDLAMVPPGEPGELYVSGVGLARGYIGRPAMTALRFVPDPFADEPGTRMYATGDRVAWEPDGRLAFLGRTDGQVKISGQRVEIGEIDFVLRGHPDVAQAAVEAVDGPHGAELVAYLTPQTAPDATAMAAYCADRLPRYMVPRRIVRLAALALNPSSKVDFPAMRHLLATPAATADAHIWETETQQAVATAWEAVLQAGEPAPEHDFLGSGGDSLLAMRLVGRLRADLGRDLAVADVFTAGTFGDLVAAVDAAPRLVATGPTPHHPPALSAAQRRLWFIDRLAPHTPAYHIAVAERLRGPLDIDALGRAWGEVLRRHETLRWRVPDRDGVPYVAVMPPQQTALTAEEIDGAAVERVLHHEASRPFDLAGGPLWRIRLLRTGPDEHVLAITVHHIVFDGWSLEVLYRDLAAAYAGGTLDAPLQYGDYVAWLDDDREQDTFDWWLDRLSGIPAVLDLPRDRARPAVSSFRGAQASTVLAAGLTGGVRGLALELDVTAHAVLLAAFGVLLARLAGQPDLLVGVPVADRRHPDLDDLVGFFVDTVAVRLDASGDLDFATVTKRAHSAVLDAMAHRSVPFERLVDGLKVPRDLSRNPLVQVMFNMYNFASTRPHLAGIDAEELPAGLPGSLFDLTLYAVERDDEIMLQAVYNPDLYDAARIDALLDSFVTLVAALVEAPAAPVGAAPARPAASTLPDLTTPLPPATTVDGLVALVGKAASDHADDIAVQGVDRTLTYRALQTRSASVATALRTADGGVGVLAARTEELPAVLLGGLASGRRFLVLDPAEPAARLRRKLDAAGITALWVGDGVSVPAELADLTDVSTEDAAEAESTGDAGSAGYLMATSGTTGEPEMVATHEAPLARFLRWYCDEFAISPTDATALLGGIGHDPLLREVFAPLLVGGRVAVPPADTLRDPVRLTGWLTAGRVTILHLTPSMGRLLASTGAAGALPAVRLLVFGGDRLTTADIARVRVIAPQASIVNGYGATETPQLPAIHVVAGEPAPDGEPVPVGQGVAGTQLLVVTPGGNPAAVGELGEIVVRSRNLADGYLDPERTAARFRVNQGDDRMFATGDLGRYDANGDVVVAGRGDQQVKVRGYRVELGEVEAALGSHPDVASAVATTQTVAGETQIVAYAVPRRAGVSTDALREHLAVLLPDYARPAAYLLIPQIPLTGNGKLDRAALPLPATARPDASHAEAATRTERLVAGVWREVLGLPRVSATDNFFEIGGHSLAIVAVQSRLKGLLGRQIDVVDLFRFPNVRALSAFLDGGQRSAGLDRADRRVAAQRARRRGGPDRPTAAK
jgi:amino acid adenylation domain-containing protein